MSGFEITANAWKSVDPLSLNEAAALWAEEDPPLVWIDDPADPQYAAHALPIDSFKRPALFKRLLVNLCEAVYLNQTLEFQRESNVHAPAINFNEIFRELREKHRKSRHTATPLKPTYFWPARLHDNDGEVTNDYDDYNPDPNHTTVSREELSKWALKIGQNPKFLKNEIERQKCPRKFEQALKWRICYQ